MHKGNTSTVVNAFASKINSVSPEDHSEPRSNPAAVLEQFSWIKGGASGPGDRLFEQVRDIAGGVAVILRMLEADDRAKTDKEQTILNATDAGSLMRFGIASLEALVDSCDQHFEWIAEYERKPAV